MIVNFFMLISRPKNQHCFDINNYNFALGELFHPLLESSSRKPSINVYFVKNGFTGASMTNGQ